MTATEWFSHKMTKKRLILFTFSALLLIGGPVVATRIFVRPSRQAEELDRRAEGPPEPARYDAVVAVEAVYPGANAQTMSKQVAIPLERGLQGIENVRQVRSRSGNDGTCLLTVAFEHGVDPKTARARVRQLVDRALPTLPEAVRRHGVHVRLKSPGPLLLVTLSAGPNRSALELGNYATLKLEGLLKRLPGVNGVTFIGQRDYSKRVWLDPQKDVGHLTPVSWKPDGYAQLDGRLAAVLGIYPTPGARPQEVSAAVRKKLARVRGQFPKDIRIEVSFDFKDNIAGAGVAKTPEYVLVDAALTKGRLRSPFEALFENTPRLALPILQRWTNQLQHLDGVQNVLVLSSNPFDRSPTRPCVLVRCSAARTPGQRRQLLTAIRKCVEPTEGMTVQLRDLAGPNAFPQCRYPLDLALSGPDPRALAAWTAKLAGHLRRTKKLTDVGTRTPPTATPAILTDIDRLNGQPMGEITGNSAPGASVTKARSLVESLVKATRKELGLSSAYRLTWLQGLPERTSR
jgi:multidrug efflux pump subunit AcrB